jgi:hypothetical protein
MMNCKRCGGKRSWPNFKVLSPHLYGGTEKTTKNRSLDSLSSGRDLNPGPPEYEAEVLTSQPRRSVSVGEYDVLVICLIGGNKERKN